MLVLVQRILCSVQECYGVWCLPGVASGKDYFREALLFSSGNSFAKGEVFNALGFATHLKALCCRKSWGRRIASFSSTRPSWKKHSGNSLRPVTSRWEHFQPLTFPPLWPREILSWFSLWFAGGSRAGARTQRCPFDSLYEKRSRWGNLELGVFHIYKGREGDSVSDSGLNQGHRLIC